MSNLFGKLEHALKDGKLKHEEKKQAARSERLDDQSGFDKRENELKATSMALDMGENRKDEIAFSKKVMEAQRKLQVASDSITASLQDVQRKYRAVLRQKTDSPMKKRQMNVYRKNAKMLFYRLGLVEEARENLKNVSDAYRYEKAMQDLVYGYKVINGISVNAGWATRLALWFHKKGASSKLSAAEWEALLNPVNVQQDVDEKELIDVYVNLEMEGDEGLLKMDASAIREAAKSNLYFEASASEAGRKAKEASKEALDIGNQYTSGKPLSTPEVKSDENPSGEDVYHSVEEARSFEDISPDDAKKALDDF